MREQLRSTGTHFYKSSTNLGYAGNAHLCCWITSRTEKNRNVITAVIKSHACDSRLANRDGCLPHSKTTASNHASSLFKIHKVQMTLLAGRNEMLSKNREDFDASSAVLHATMW
jgi:hypothetical protein